MSDIILVCPHYCIDIITNKLQNIYDNCLYCIDAISASESCNTSPFIKRFVNITYENKSNIQQKLSDISTNIIGFSYNSLNNSHIKSHILLSNNKHVTLLYDGNIFNCDYLKEKLKRLNYRFDNDNNFDVIINYIEHEYNSLLKNINNKDKDDYVIQNNYSELFIEAINNTLFNIEGTFSIILMCSLCSNKIYTFTKYNKLYTTTNNAIPIISNNKQAILNENETVITLQSNLIYVIDIFNYKYSNNTQLMINYIHPKEIYI